jgi:hypothetical protein
VVGPDIVGGDLQRSGFITESFEAGDCGPEPMLSAVGRVLDDDPAGVSVPDDPEHFIPQAA